MIELIDQSDPNALVFHCDNCGRSFKQPNFAALDLHTPNVGADARKAGIPPCQPLPVKPQPAKEPEPEAEPVKESKVKK